VSDKKGESDFLQLLALGPYRLLGDRLVKLLPLFRDIEKKLPKANIRVAFVADVSVMLFFSAISVVSIFSIVFLISWLSGALLVNALLVAFALAVLCGFFVFILCPFEKKLYRFPQIPLVYCQCLCTCFRFTYCYMIKQSFKGSINKKIQKVDLKNYTVLNKFT
jgi:hypothetical protein